MVRIVFQPCRAVAVHLLASLVVAGGTGAQAAASSSPDSAAQHRRKAAAAPPARPLRDAVPIEADRPDFTEASTTVGKGRTQLEVGYTRSRDRNGGATDAATFPEALLRVGLFADWFEFRLGQTLSSSRTADAGEAIIVRGAEDLYVGAKFAVSQQSRLRPEAVVLLQSTLPTGHRDFRARGALPGVNLLYGWDVVPGALAVGGSTQVNASENVGGSRYAEFAQAVTVGYDFTERLGAYGEVFSIVPTGRNSTGLPATHYANGGLRFRITPNLQYDVRVGAGLNRAADDFFVGVGLAVRR